MDESHLSSAPAQTGVTVLDKGYRENCQSGISGEAWHATCYPRSSEKSAPKTTPVPEKEAAVGAMRGGDDYRLFFTYAPSVPAPLRLPLDGTQAWYDAPPKFEGARNLPSPERYWLRYRTFVCFQNQRTGEITSPVAIEGTEFTFTRRGIPKNVANSSHHKEPC